MSRTYRSIAAAKRMRRLPPSSALELIGKPGVIGLAEPEHVSHRRRLAVDSHAIDCAGVDVAIDQAAHYLAHRELVLLGQVQHIVALDLVEPKLQDVTETFVRRERRPSRTAGC